MRRASINSACICIRVAIRDQKVHSSRMPRNAAQIVCVLQPLCCGVSVVIHLVFVHGILLYLNIPLGVVHMIAFDIESVSIEGSKGDVLVSCSL